MVACRWLGSRKDSVRDYNQQKGDEPYYWGKRTPLYNEHVQATRGVGKLGA